MEVTIPFLFCQINQLVENFERFWLLFGVEHGLQEAVEVAAAPVEVVVVGLFEEVGDALDDLDEQFGPAWSHEVSDDLPSFDRTVVDDELVLLPILSFGRDFDGIPNVREGQVHLFEVVISLELHLLDLALLDRGLGEKGATVELILLINSLEEDICHPAGALVARVGKEGDLDVHEDDLCGELLEAVPRVLHNNLLTFIHALLALGDVFLVFFGIPNEERRIFEKFPQFEFLSTH